MPFQPVVLVTDALLFVLLGLIVGAVWRARRSPPMRRAWRDVGRSRSGMASATILVAFLGIGVADSLHYRPLLESAGGTKSSVYSAEVLSALDAALTPLRVRVERTYSAPLATRSFAKETIESESGAIARDYPRLQFAGAQLADPDRDRDQDVRNRLLRGIGLGLGAAVLTCLGLGTFLGRGQEGGCASGWWAILSGRTTVRWRAALITVLGLGAVIGGLAALAPVYHVFGTDKVGQDVLYLTLKSVRTALVIGTLTTLVLLPVALALGVLAGYLGGWVDDLIQYVYTVLNSIPGVLLIAAAVLMMQGLIDRHPEWFSTAAERADARLLALCCILGLTSWTGLARLLRGEALKLRELEYVQAARAFGVGTPRILLRHILPNVMHIVLIAVVMDFSSLVLAEAVLSYVGIGVDPNTISFGTMINAARMELAREPMVWWSLGSAFVFMFTLVLSANLFADAVRDAFDPRRG
ncbi:MAG: ABC transporter permease [Zoogloeaceae bacterium]|nr:ABC transporter permease [Zoogloeaceae bacterium]